MKKAHTYIALPEGYREYFHVNLQKDRKTALFVNITALVVGILMFALGHFAFVSITDLYDMDDGLLIYFGRIIALLLGFVIYIVLHELTHAAVMKFFGAKKLRFGYTGIYAYAGSETDFFDKHAYIPISLAPLIVWGIIFTVLLIVVPRSWFWVVYFWQIGNITGAMGDLYVTFKFSPMPKDILIRDTGTEMTIYSKA